MIADVIIIGGGISGLACAMAVRQSGLTPLILDASDAIGGRVRTDKHGGFLLDRGFQVLQTWYPEARRLLDCEALDLRPFDPGAIVRFDGRFYRVTDVWRRPARLLEMALSPVATTADKLRLLALRRRALRGDLRELYERPETEAISMLKGLGFSPRIVEPQLRKELVRWFGSDAERWERLAVYRLPAALPDQAPPVPYPGERKVMVSEGLRVCGALGGAPSIQWALHSGTRAGESVSAAVLGR